MASIGTLFDALRESLPGFDSIRLRPKFQSLIFSKLIDII